MSDLPAATKKNGDAPFGYCSVTTTGTSSICQKGGLSAGGRLIRTAVDANLGYLEHLARGRDDLLEAMDCVPCSSRSASTLATLRRTLTEFALNVADEEDGPVWVEPVDVRHDAIGEMQINK